MKVETRTEHYVHLDELERWDFTGAYGPTINVEQIDISLPSSLGRRVWFKGQRRLKRGGLSIQDPIYVTATLDDIPKNLWRKLKTAKVLSPQRVSPVVVQ